MVTTPPSKRLDSQGQSTDYDVSASLSHVGRVICSVQLETQSSKDDVIVVDDTVKTDSNWRLSRPNSGQVTKAHSFTTHSPVQECLLLSSGSLDSSASKILRAEKQSKFLRSASGPAQPMTPQMLHQRISALISANTAILDTPMADPPRPKRLSRQNSENKEYTQPRLKDYTQPRLLLTKLDTKRQLLAVPAL